MVQPIRRLVTGHDERGRSVFVEDRASPNIHVFERFGGTAVTELWATPEPGDGKDAAAGETYRLEPAIDWESAFSRSAIVSAWGS